MLIVYAILIVYAMASGSRARSTASADTSQSPYHLISTSLRRLHLRVTCSIVVTAAVATTIGPAYAQSNPLYVQLGRAKGALYKPDSGAEPTVAVLLMHRTANFLSHPATRELSRRGFLVLGMNSRFDNNEASVRWEQIALDVRSGVEYLRRQPGITHVVLFGHSGGGPTMSFYQAVAEHGPSYCQGPNKLSECGGDLFGLPEADALILVDAHAGNPINSMNGLNPAVRDEADLKSRIDPAFDPFDPDNGYRADGQSTYSDEFEERYYRAQADRMNRLIGLAEEQLADMEPDQDEVFLVVGGQGARLAALDSSIREHLVTKQPRKLLRNDGTVVTRIVESSYRPDRRSAADAAIAAGGPGGTRVLTVRSFLSANAIRGTHSITGIDYCSSNNSTPCAVRRVSVPLLVVAAGGYNFIRDNELHYELAASQDKDFVIVEGATHGFAPCTECEVTSGQYSNVTRNFYDYVQMWLDDRF